MRAASRLVALRRALGVVHQRTQRAALDAFLRGQHERLDQSMFERRDPVAIAAEVRARGLALGLDLPADVVDEIHRHALDTPCYADRDPALGFAPADRARADAALGKPILVAQHFNVLRDSDAARQVATDPLVNAVAAEYLGVVPRLVGLSLWWTFPVDPTDADRDRHAHLWHRDLDDIDFVKFFFYLTDVEPGDGGHHCVVGSHRAVTGRPRRQAVRRHTDDEVRLAYPSDQRHELCGPAGTGFVETTLCLHKGSTPVHRPRLLLQLEFAHFDYGLAHDHRADDELAMIPTDTHLVGA